MHWFANWWNGLGGFGQAFACAAIPSSILMILQTLSLLFSGAFGHQADNGEASGFDSADTDADTDFDTDVDVDADFDTDVDVDVDSGVSGVSVANAGQSVGHDMSHAADGMRLFTLRGMIAFFAVGGWTGLAVWDGSASQILSIISALLAGSAAMVFAALVIRWALNMQDNGNLNLSNAISKTGTVYIPIPPSRASTGRITLLMQERFVELEAVTDHNETLRTGGEVQVVGVAAGGTLVVRPAQAEERTGG